MTELTKLLFRCIKCTRRLPRIEFYKDRDRPRRIKRTCRECYAGINAAAYRARKERAACST